MPATQPAAIVTGASRGIGRAVAWELAGLGYQVVVNYCSNRDAAEEAAAGIKERGREALVLRADVAQAADRQTLVEQTLERFGRLDLLVNNAGITSPGRRDLLDVDERGWDRVMAVNLKGPFFLAQRAAREMARLVRESAIPGGKIINISSISAIAVSTDRADYCLAKAAMGMMTHLFATRLAGEKISVFEICPGVVETGMTAPVRQKYDQLFSQGLAPIARWGKPDDVAKVVAAIAQDYFPYTTGQRFYVDGGMHIRRL